MMKKLFISLCMAVLLTAMVVIPSVHAEERPLEESCLFVKLMGLWSQ